jgi:hypothetical protein
LEKDRKDLTAWNFCPDKQYIIDLLKVSSPVEYLFLKTFPLVDNFQYASADDEAELTVLRVVDRVGFIGEKHHFANVDCHAVALF